MTTMDGTALNRAKEAVRVHDWDGAVAALSEIDGLSSDALIMYAEALWWSGDPEAAITAWESGFRSLVAESRVEDAAQVAIRLSELAYRRGALTVGKGWLNRATRLLEDLPDSVVHGWLDVQRTAIAILSENDLAKAISLAKSALSVARSHQDPELEAVALSLNGTILVRQGRWQEGMAMIDEAALAAGAGELSPRSACDVYCITITTCCDATDYRRASEWTEQVDRWMQRQSVHGYRGECKIHRAELKRRHGAWQEAEEEAKTACSELESFQLLDSAAAAYYELGEIRLRMGDLNGAEENFNRARQLGHGGQPGSAMLMALRGDPTGASAVIDRILGSEPAGHDGIHFGDDLLERSRLLPSAVDLRLTIGDIEGAVAAAEELRKLSDLYDSESLEGSVHQALGAVALAGGDATTAISHLVKARRTWQQIDFPYELGRTCVLLGQAYTATGDEDAARLELEAARETFSRLGARLDLKTVADLLADAGEESTARSTKTFLFTDIVTSTDMAALLGDEGWTQLLGWHDRQLREIFSRHRGEEVKHTGDGFFVAFDQPGDAIQAATEIQRSLTAHRRDHGFAPRVRIGLHAGEASRVGADYTGQAVNVAARIGSAAEGDEILASADVVGAGDSSTAQVGVPRQLDLKGVKQPVEVFPVIW